MPLPPPPLSPWRMSARAALSTRSSPSLLVALFLPLLSFPAFAQLSNKRLSPPKKVSPDAYHQRVLRTETSRRKREEEEEEEERLYLHLETRERVQTNEAKSKRRRASPT
jgi:hypothetical protein